MLFTYILSCMPLFMDLDRPCLICGKAWAELLAKNPSFFFIYVLQGIIRKAILNLTYIEEHFWSLNFFSGKFAFNRLSNFFSAFKNRQGFSNVSTKINIISTFTFLSLTLFNNIIIMFNNLLHIHILFRDAFFQEKDGNVWNV